MKWRGETALGTLGRPPGECAACPFCDLAGRDLVAQNDLAVAFLDGFPVNPDHTLIVPRRHLPTRFDALREEPVHGRGAG